MKLISNINDIDITPIEDIVNYHVVWFGNPLDHHVLCISSLFETQHNPCVTLWTSDTYVSHLRDVLCPMFKDKQFKVEVFRSINEGVLYPKEVEDLFWTCDDWRLDILYTYGGIYVDIDTLALKDISWISRYRGISRWGKDDRCNSSIVSFSKGDIELLKLFNVMKTIENRKGWHRSVPNFEWSLLDIDMYCFDVEFFDCGWGGGGVGWDTFFTSIPDTNEPFNWSFMYHWHNHWTLDVRNPNTLIGTYWKKFVIDTGRLST